MMKKQISLLVAGAVALSGLLAGCGSGKKTSADGKEVLRIEIFERGDVPEGAGSVTDNAMTKWVQKEFGDPNNIKVEYVSVPRASEASQLNISMAANEAPDIIFTYGYSILYDFYAKGGLTDLSDYMEKAPQLTKFLGKDLLKEGRIDGKQILVPAKRLVRGQTGQLIRKDWLDALGMNIPTNIDEFYTVLKAFKEKDPGKNGDKNIPYGFAFHTPMFTDLIRNFITSDMTDKEITCTPIILQDGFKEGLRFINKLYNEGLISPDFALDKDRKQYDSDVANGYVGFINDDLGRPLQAGGTYSVLKKSNPNAEFAALDTWTNKDGKHLKTVYSLNGMYIAVPKVSEKNAENAMKYLNWMADDDVLKTLQYGFEGKNYKLDQNGIPEVIDTKEANKTHWYNLGFDLALIVNGKYNPDPEKIIDMAATATIAPDVYKENFKYSIEDGFCAKVLPPTNENKSLLETTLSETENEIYVKGITASEGAFDSVVDKLIAEYKKAGGNEIKKINEELYKQAYNK